MKNIVIVGSGWRSLFFVRVIKAMPDKFKLLAMLTRSEETALRVACENGIYVTTNEKECVDLNPDLVVVATSKTNIVDTAIKWANYGFEVLMETPAGISEEDFGKFETCNCKDKISVAEQYHRYPMFQAIKVVLETGILGNINDIVMSLCHDYHAVSLMRFFFGNIDGAKVLFNTEYPINVLETGNRGGVLHDGSLKEYKRSIALLEFSANRHATYDFSSLLYHTEIANQGLIIRGSLGEYKDGEFIFAQVAKNTGKVDEGKLVSKVDETHKETVEKYRYCKERLEINYSGSEVEKICFRGKCLWTNPYLNLGFGNDEIAIADLLLDKSKYSLDFAIEDARLGLALHHKPAI